MSSSSPVEDSQSRHSVQEQRSQINEGSQSSLVQSQIHLSYQVSKDEKLLSQLVSQIDQTLKSITREHSNSTMKKSTKNVNTELKTSLFSAKRALQILVDENQRQKKQKQINWSLGELFNQKQVMEQKEQQQRLNIEISQSFDDQDIPSNVAEQSAQSVQQRQQLQYLRIYQRLQADYMPIYEPPEQEDQQI